MGLFRRRQETLNEQLLREAGLAPAQSLGTPPPAPPPEPAPEPPRFTGDSAVGRQEWDATVTATAPTLAGDRVEFTTLPSGDVIVSEEDGEGDLMPLAAAVERQLSPPYRAVGQRRDGDLWGVGAKRIRVAQIPFPDGDRLELSQHVDHGELRVDGEPSDALVPAELERLGETLGDSFSVEAERIDGDVWEVRATAL